MSGKNVDWTFDWRAERDVWQAGAKLAETKATLERMAGELDAMLADLQRESPVAFNQPQRLRALNAAMATVDKAARDVGLFRDMTRGDLGQIASAVSVVHQLADQGQDEVDAFYAPSECRAAVEAGRASGVKGVLAAAGMDADRLLDAVGARTSEKWAFQSLRLE